MVKPKLWGGLSPTISELNTSPTSGYGNLLGDRHLVETVGIGYLSSHQGLELFSVHKPSDCPLSSWVAGEAKAMLTQEVVNLLLQPKRQKLGSAL